MPNLPLRFGTGEGLEAAVNKQTQRGYLALDNVSLELRDNIEKRPGSEQIALTTGSDPNDVLDSIGLQNVAYRDNELCVWTDNEMYSRNLASVDNATEVPVGEATDEQIQLFIQDAQAEDITRKPFTLPGHPDAPSVVDQLRDVRPTSASISGTWTTIFQPPSGGVTIDDTLYDGQVNIDPTGRLTFSGSFNILGQTQTRTNFEVEDAGAYDVRLAFYQSRFFGQDEYFAQFLVSYRVGNFLRIKEVKFGREQVFGSGPVQIGENYIRATNWRADMNYPIEQNYEMLNQDLIDAPFPGVGVNSTGIALYTYNLLNINIQVYHHHISLAVGIINADLDYTGSISGLTVRNGDIIRGVRQPVGGNQTVALFRYSSSGNVLSYTPLSFFGPGPQIGPTMNVGYEANTNCPNVLRTSDTNRQIVAIPNDVGTNGIGWTIFTGNQTDIDWVAAVRASSSLAQTTTTHTCEARLDSTNWLILRDDQTILAQALGPGSKTRAVLNISNTLVALRSLSNTIYRTTFRPGNIDGPLVTFSSVHTGANLAVGQISNRVAYSFNNGNQLRVVSSADGVAFNNGNQENLGATIFEFNGTVAGRLIDLAAVAPDQISAKLYYFTQAGATISLNRRTVSTLDPVQGTVLSIAVANPAQIYAADLGTFDLIYVLDSDQNIVVYEFGADYAIQVNPRLLSIGAGNFGRRGPWTSTRLRQEVPIIAPGGGTIVACDVAEIDGVRIAMFQVSGGTTPGIYTSIYSDHFELLNGNIVLTDSNGFRPKVCVNHQARSVLLTYLDGAPNTNRVRVALWTPESSIVFNDLLDGASAPIVAQDSIYDTLAVNTLAVNNLQNKFLIVTKTNTAELRLTRVSATDLSLQITETVGFISNITGAIAVTIESVADTQFILRAAAATATAIRTLRASIPDGGGLTVITPSSNSFVVVGTDVLRMAIASPFGDSRFNIAYETLTFVKLIRNTLGSEISSDYKNYFLCSIYSSGLTVSNGHSYVVLSGATTASTGYYMIDMDSDRNGSSGAPQEIISRPFAGEGELNTLNRTTTVHLDYPSINSQKDISRLVFSALVQNRGTTVGTANLGTFGIVNVVFDPTNFVPAELDKVIVHAHGGYMRAYAGDVPFEHDWHGFPVCSVSTQTTGGSIIPGNYGVGVNYEETDPQGNIYRSATFFTTINVPVGTNTNQITISVSPLSLTERRNVLISAWRTVVSGTSVYYRDVTVSNNSNATANQSIVLVRSDSSLQTGEILDNTRLTRTPTPSTDFVAAIKGRFFTRDPERSSLVRFTTPRLEGLAPSGNFSLGIESPTQRAVTAMSEFDGRVVIFTQFEYSIFQGSGPDVNGNGSFTESDLTPSQIGCTGQPTIARIEPGITFGSINGPRLISRSIDTQDFGDRVYRFFEDEGYSVIRSIYVPPQETLYIYSTNGINDLTLKLHVSNQRWALDTNRNIISAAVSNAGEIAYLTRDGRLLIEGDDLTQTRYQPLLAMRSILGFNPDYLWAGDHIDEVNRGRTTQVELVPSGGTFIAPNNGLGVFGANSFEFTGLDNQHYTSPDTTIADIDQSTVIIWHARHDVNPTGVKVYGGKQNQTGVDAFRGWVSFGFTSGPTFRLADTLTNNRDVNLTTASYGVGEDRIFVAVIDYLAQEVRFGSDVENGTPISFDPSLIYTTSAAFRIGDARHQTGSQQAIDGQENFWLIKKGQEFASLIQDPQLLAQQIKNALQTGEGVASISVLTDRSDGDVGYVTRFTTPPFRNPTEDGKVHPRFILQSAKISGQYLGSHDLFVNVYLDFNPIPVIQAVVPRNTINDNALLGKPYIYEIDVKKECFAAVIEFFDGGEKNETFRVDAIDITWDAAPNAKQYTFGSSAKFAKVETVIIPEV